VGEAKEEGREDDQTGLFFLYFFSEKNKNKSRSPLDLFFFFFLDFLDKPDVSHSALSQ
jgi:hypothetical protein